MSTSHAIAELEALLASGHALLHLHTIEEARWLRELRALAERSGVALRVWNETRGLEGDRDDAVAREPLGLLRRLGEIEDRTWFVLADFHPWLGDHAVVRQLRDLEPVLARRGSAAILVSPVLTVPPELERDLTVVELPLPDARDLRPMVAKALATGAAAVSKTGARGTDEALGERVERALLGLTESAAKRVLARSLRESASGGRDLVRAIVSEKRRILTRSDLLEFLDPGVGLADVGGLDELKRWIERRGPAFGEAARARGLPPPRGLLMLGVQGCGKSLTSRAVADAWSFPLIRLDLSAVIRAERQAREEGLRRALTIAEMLAPAVLWVDELEKGFADSGSAGEGAVARALATFLTWMQEKKGAVFVVATANRVDRLPAELVRKGRFDEIFFVDLPTLSERRQIVTIHLAKRKLDPERFDVAALSRVSAGLSGSEIEQGILSACYEAFAEGREPTTREVQAAMKSSVPLAVTMAEQIDQLREWAEKRARPACLDNRLNDMIAETLAGSGREPESAS